MRRRIDRFAFASIFTACKRRPSERRKGVLGGGIRDWAVGERADLATEGREDDEDDETREDRGRDADRAVIPIDAAAMSSGGARDGRRRDGGSERAAIAFPDWIELLFSGLPRLGLYARPPLSRHGGTSRVHVRLRVNRSRSRSPRRFGALRAIRYLESTIPSNPYIGLLSRLHLLLCSALLQIDRSTWGASVVVKRNAATVLAKELRRLPRDSSQSRTATDPYQFRQGSIELPRHALEVLLRARWPVSVLSRAPLMIRDLDLSTQFPEIEVGMSVHTR